MAVFIGIFVVFVVVFYFWIKDIYIEHTKIDLLHNIDIISLQIKDLKKIDGKIKDIKKLTNLRVTIIDKDGIVVGESDKDKSLMDNHKTRKEIIESKYQKYGSTIRYSKTLKKELLYVSKKFILNDNEYYIRMARNIEQISQEFLFLSFKVAFLFMLFIAFIFLVTSNISKKVQNETNAVLKFLDDLTKQNKALQINSTYSLEFNKITKLLTQTSNSLAKKDKQKSKYTAKLKLANRQKDDIISAISHEFKNPIAVISGYAQALVEDKDININIKNKFLDKISSNSIKLTKMIDRLRMSIRLEDGKQQYNLTNCNITNLTKIIIEDLKLSYPSREILLEAKDIVIKADETMISIAITNLIENALKYSQDLVTVNISNKYLSIVDTGVGLKAKDIPKITDKFYRVSSNGWNNSLGVGLSLVANILKVHNFKLDIKSAENKGSTFNIFF